ncbi:BA75_02067T0 [Komagataella pastoris]|uniref:Pre-mRNA-splicing factor CWC2 n=1 Tax=Komagataella pastoris TaxID=4922 RepID=A0A1B2JB05_PICPA|nr:BA75_02067T0 [Komagataella pastoris]
MARRPARVQVDPESIDSNERPPQTGNIFNIWYSKWSGGDSSDRNTQTHSKTRCNIERDSGYTKADKEQDPFFCLYFSRGACCLGKKCEYLHRLPKETDSWIPHTLDCFGREKFAEYRDDMGGVGNFNKINRTLFVGRINEMDDSIELKISKNFAEWGEIDRIRVIPTKNIAFVTYRNELNAQFAKEAMAHQSLDLDNENEILSVKWANEDPNPESKAKIEHEHNLRKLSVAKQLVEKLEKLKQYESEKRSAVTVEEPDKIEDFSPKRQKMIQPSPLTPAFFNGSLSVLSELKQKKAHPQKNQTLVEYSSDDSD